MNTQDFLRQAADSLNQAAQARKQEIDQLQRELAQRTQEEQNRISDIKNKQAVNLTATSISPDDVGTTLRRNTLQTLRNEEAQLKNNLDKYRKDMDNAIAEKQRSVEQITQLAQSVSSWAQV